MAKVEKENIVEANTLYGTVKAVSAAIVKAHASTKDIQREYQRIAVSVLLILQKNRDISVVRNLFTQMTTDLPESLRVDAMQAFFCKFAPVKYDVGSKAFTFDKEGTFDVEGAMTTAWWTATPRQNYKPFDLQSEINALYERAVKRASEPKSENDVIDMATLGALRNLIKGGNTAPKQAKATPVAKKAKKAA